MAERHRNDAVLADNVPTFAIPDKLCSESGISISWSGEESFGIFPHERVSYKDKDRKSPYAADSFCEDRVHHVRTSSILFDPIARKLVNESDGYFIVAQKLTERCSPTDFSLEILKLSRQYRSVLRACLEGFQNESENCTNSDRKQFYLQNIPTFYNMELIWHLCEIIFIDVVPGDLVLSQLITWIRFHVPQVERDANKLLSGEVIDVDCAPNYWLIVIDCLLQRRIDTVRSLLRLHSQADTEPYRLADTILRTMPVFELYGGLTATEFKIRHECWKQEAKRLLIDGNFSSHKYLSIIVKILVGDESVQEIIQKHCETWYQHMVASLLYTDPTVKIFDLAYHANRSIVRYGGPDFVKQLDMILCAIMEIDIFKVIERLQDWTEKNWLPTHLTNLLYLCGRLNVPGPQPNNTGSNIHENLLLNYGTLLMSHKSLWQVGVDYLDFCPNEGRGRLEVLLSKIPFKTDEKALKIIQIARERDLGEVVCTVGKAQGMRYLARGNIGAALTWAMRSQDPVFASQIADIYLKDYIKQGSFKSTDLLQNLGSGIMLSDRLAFLGRYCEFCQMQRAGELKEAGALLVYMLNNKVPPKYFWLTLFVDALPLIENDKGIFSSEDIYDLMSGLEELTDDSDELNLPESKIIEVQHALGKNLAVALIKEGSKNICLEVNAQQISSY